jgi:hypothetical protein
MPYGNRKLKIEGCVDVTVFDDRVVERQKLGPREYTNGHSYYFVKPFNRRASQMISPHEKNGDSEIPWRDRSIGISMWVSLHRMTSTLKFGSVKQCGPEHGRGPELGWTRQKSSSGSKFEWTQLDNDSRTQPLVVNVPAPKKESNYNNSHQTKNICSTRGARRRRMKKMKKNADAR